MGNVLVDAAKGLHLMGMPVPSVAFIEMLINEGEDVLAVIPRLVTTIDALGGGAGVLEEIAWGIEQYGPVAYVQRLVDQYFAPGIQNVQTIHNGKASLIATHRALLTNVSSQLTTLSPQNGLAVASVQDMTFTGSAANAMNVHLASIAVQTNHLLNTMDQSHQIDEDLLTQLQFVMKVGLGMATVDVALLAIGLLLVPVTAGGSLAIAGIVDAGLLAGEAEILLGAIIACFIVWAGRHAILAITTSLAPTHTQPVTSHPAQSGVTINETRAHQNDLPTEGERPYIPPKTAKGDPSKAWDNTQKGFKDADGNVWQWPPAGALHGGPHWDVQHPNGKHTNVAPNGTVIGGPAKDNFPNKRR